MSLPVPVDVAHANGLLDAVLSGLEAAKSGGAFGNTEPFLVVWLSDSGLDEIMAKSVRLLNSAMVAKAFLAKFG